MCHVGNRPAYRQAGMPVPYGWRRDNVGNGLRPFPTGVKRGFSFLTPRRIALAFLFAEGIIEGMDVGVKGNLFAKIPGRIEKEIFEALVEKPGLNIHRILSQGQTTDWQSQETDEWVVLFAGKAKLLFEEGNREVVMGPGDYVQIPAGCRHRVSWTDPSQKTVWLAVQYNILRTG